MDLGRKKKAKKRGRGGGRDRERKKGIVPVSQKRPTLQRTVLGVGNVEPKAGAVPETRAITRPVQHRDPRQKRKGK